MTRRQTAAIVAVVVAFVWVSGTRAQGTGTGTAQKPPAAAAKSGEKPGQATPPKAAEPPIPADYKAVMDAAKIEDPAKRLEAMQKAVAVLVRRNTAPPPDQKAYSDALRLTDPTRKVEALQRVIRDFPKASFVSNAEYELIAAMIGDAKKQVLAQANKVIDATDEAGKPMMMNNIADKMMVGEMLLDQA